MPLTGTAAPATGPSAGPGSGVGTGQQQSAPSMAPDILSYGRRPPPPSNLGGQSPPHRPSCDSPPPPHPGATATAAWPAVGDRCPSALDPTPAPRVHVPLFRPLEWNPEMGPISPPTEYACSGHDLIFFVDTGFAHRMWEPRPGTPPGIDPPQNFYKQNMVGRRDLRAPTSGLVCGHPYLPPGPPQSWLPGPHDDPQPFDHHLLFRRLGRHFGLAGE